MVETRVHLHSNSPIPNLNLCDPTGLGAPTYAAPGNGLDDDGDGEVDEEGGEVIALLGQPLAERKDRVIDLAAGERPAILGDQSIWWVMNDRGNEHRVTRSPPIGIEVHAMAFAFEVPGPIGDATFYKYDFHFRGEDKLTEAYLGLGVDPDLGHFQDDWVGSDTARGIGFVWNSDNDDEGGSGYGTPSPALGFDFFQGPIVPSMGDTAHVSGAPVPDFRNLKMAHFVYYPNGGCVICDPRYASGFYNYMRGRWNDGKTITEGGNGRDFSGIPVAYMFPGDVGESDEECQYWSECNADDKGTDIISANRRFVMSTGPFTISPEDPQQIILGIVFARGANNFNSVTKMKQADDLAQAFVDANFMAPAPPAAPDLAATPADQSVILEWKSAAGSNNYLESYSAEDPFILNEDNEYLFEGYDVIQYDHGEDFVGRTIATYDVRNGVTRVVDGFPGEPQEVTATGSDSGVATSHTVTGLTNYTTYHFGVQAYAYNAPSYPKVYRGPIARVEVIPTRPTQDVSDAALALAQDHGAPDFVAEAVAVGDGEVFAHVTNPITLVDANYAVEFFAQNFGKQPNSTTAEEDDTLDPLRPSVLPRMGSSATTGVTYNILRGGEVLFDGSALDFPAPLRRGVFASDGLTFDVLGPPPGFKDFHVTANAAGPLDPPDYAGWGWAGFPDPRGLVVGLRTYQQVSGAVWGYHAGGAAQPFGPIEEGSSFLARVLRGGTLLPYLGSYDYEQRFTQECADQIDGTLDVEHDCLAIRWYGDDALIEVPFTLWRAGIDTPEDRSDDLQMVPFLCDSETCGGGTEHGVYDIGGDHPASGADNDPYTDWIYWNLPADTRPGSAGYRAFFRGNDQATTVQVLARTVLVAWNEGTAPPYERPLPESGTVLRIISNKQNQPGDRYLLSTHGYGAVQPEGERARARLKDIGIVPNPYKGASNYEVSQLTSEVRFTNLPDVATIRIFTLNGTLIKTIEKRSPGVATISWNLVTDYNLAIASGVYLVHVTAPEVGSTVLKFAVIKKRIQLNTF